MRVKAVARKNPKVIGAVFGMQLRGVIRLNIPRHKNLVSALGMPRQDLDNRTLHGGIGLQDDDLTR